MKKAVTYKHRVITGLAVRKTNNVMGTVAPKVKNVATDRAMRQIAESPRTMSLWKRIRRRVSVNVQRDKVSVPKWLAANVNATRPMALSGTILGKSVSALIIKLMSMASVWLSGAIQQKIGRHLVGLLQHVIALSVMKDVDTTVQRKGEIPVVMACVRICVLKMVNGNITQVPKITLARQWMVSSNALTGVLRR